MKKNFTKFGLMESPHVPPHTALMRLGKGWSHLGFTMLPQTWRKLIMRVSQALDFIHMPFKVFGDLARLELERLNWLGPTWVQLEWAKQIFGAKSGRSVWTHSYCFARFIPIWTVRFGPIYIGSTGSGCFIANGWGRFWSTGWVTSWSVRYTHANGIIILWLHIFINN